MKNFSLALFGALLLLSSIATAQTIILEEDFEGGSLPSGWTSSSDATDNGWQFGTNTQIQSSSFPISAHTKMAGTNDDDCDCDKSMDYLITPSVDLTGHEYVFLSFASYYYNLSYNGVTENATIEASTDGGNTWTLVTEVPANTGNWETKVLNLSAYAGQSDVLFAFHYDDGGEWLYGWAIDDVSIYAPVAGTDISVSTFSVGKYDPTPAFVGFPTYFSGSELSGKATIYNTGTETITSFDISWTDGINTYSESVTGVNIPLLSAYEFTPATPYVVMDGDHTLSFEITSVNGGATEISETNNLLSYSVEGIKLNADRKYLAEEGTGTWCGWCPRGTVFMEYMRKTYPDHFVGIAVHNGDPMVNDEYDSELGINAFPTVTINRKTDIDPSELEFDFIAKMATTPSVTITAEALVNETTNEMTINTQASFLQTLTGDYRIAAVLVEDSVHGTASGYKQTNYYANNAAGPMAGWENLGSSVPAAQMWYDQVGRELVGGFDGVAGSLPATMNAGETYSHTLTYDIPGNINLNHAWVAVMVIKHSNGEIMNSNQTGLEFTTGIGNVTPNASLYLYPNPSTEVAHLSIKMDEANEVTIRIVNALGQVAGLHHFNSLSGSVVLPLDVAELTNGLYQVVTTVGDQQYVKKLVVNH